MKQKYFLFLYLTKTEAAAAAGASSNCCDRSRYILNRRFKLKAIQLKASGIGFHSQVTCAKEEGSSFLLQSQYRHTDS